MLSFAVLLVAIFSLGICGVEEAPPPPCTRSSSWLSCAPREPSQGSLPPAACAGGTGQGGQVGKEGRSPTCQLSSPEGGSGSQSWSSGGRKPSGCCPSAPWAPFGWEFWGSGRGAREGRGSCLPFWIRGGGLWGSSLGEAGPLPNWSLILGFAIGVQQVPPTLIQRTYG